MSACEVVKVPQVEQTARGLGSGVGIWKPIDQSALLLKPCGASLEIKREALAQVKY